MQLNIMDRLMILNALPKEGNIAQMRMRLRLIDKVGFTSEELEKHEIRDDGSGNLHWEKEFEKEVDIKPAEHSMISEVLKKASEDNQLHPEQVPIYNKFVDEE